MENRITGAELKKLEQANGSYNAAMNKPRNPMADAMGKDQFLKLLVTQLSKQDPMNPMDNTQFIAQMAQFSSLEQMHNVSTSVEKLTSNINRLEMQSLIGRNVMYIPSGMEQPRTGFVDSIVYDTSGTPKLMVGNDQVQMNELLTVTSGDAALARNAYSRFESTRIEVPAESGVTAK